VDLDVEFEFTLNRFTRERSVSSLDPTSGATTTVTHERALEHYDFVLLQVAGVPLGRLRPWVGAGAGLALGYFADTEPSPDDVPAEARLTRPVVRAAAGLELALGRNLILGLRTTYGWVTWKPAPRAGNATRVPIFGDRMAATLGLMYRQ
jgi:hypothetical protein